MRKISSNQKYWALIIISSITFLALLIFLIQITMKGKSMALGDFSWYSFIRSVVLSSPFAIGIIYTDYKIVRFINGNKWLLSHFFSRLLFEIIFIFALALVFIILGNIPYYYNYDLNLFLNEIFYNGSVLAAILINIFIVLIVEFFVQNRKSQILQQENSKIQYQQLKSQINPHFLFNSLNVLVSLINKDSERATDYTKKLSDVYRYVLTHDTEDIVLVEDELDFIRNYIEILQIRFGKGLKIEFDVEEQDLKKSIPPMSLQILVENAVKHNVLSPSNPLFIKISSDKSDIIVSNSSMPRLNIGNCIGIGLDNLRAKYQIMADKNVIIERNDKEFIVKLPLL